MTSVPLTIQPEEVEAWRPRETLGVVEWAERYRVLSRKTSEISGRWSWDYCPYLVEPAEAWTDPAVRAVVLAKPTQTGGTELANNIVGRTIFCDPAPLLVVMPVERDVRRRVRTRLRPMFESAPSLMAHLPGGDVDNLNIGDETVLDHMILYLGWATSAAALADSPVCYVILDEIGKYPARVGREADPISLAEDRQRTFYWATTLIVSSPTDTESILQREYMGGDRCEYNAPCPKCGTFQPLVWPNVELDKDDDGHLLPPGTYAAGGRARYRCAACREAWTESERWEATLAGVYVPEGGQAVPIGRRRRGEPGREARSWAARRAGRGADVWIAGDLAPHRTRSFHYTALAAYWGFVSVADLAAKWAAACVARSAGDIGPMVNFINAQLGEPWEERDTETAVDVLRARVESRREDLVPPESGILTAGVDVQADHVYLCVWAWAYLFEGWLVRYERVPTGDTRQLENWGPVADALERAYEVETDAGDPPRPPVPITLAFVDSGFRPTEVYTFCRSMISTDTRPVKGQPNLEVPYRSGVLEYDPRSGKVAAYSIRLWSLQVDLFKDRLAHQYHVPEAGPGYVHFPAGASTELLMQLSAEHRRIIRTRSGLMRSAWVRRPDRPRNHWWDCSVYALAAADVAGVRNLPRPGEAPAGPPRRRVTRMERFRRD